MVKGGVFDLGSLSKLNRVVDEMMRKLPTSLNIVFFDRPSSTSDLKEFAGNEVKHGRKLMNDLVQLNSGWGIDEIIRWR